MLKAFMMMETFYLPEYFSRRPKVFLFTYQWGKLPKRRMVHQATLDVFYLVRSTSCNSSCLVQGLNMNALCTSKEIPHQSDGSQRERVAPHKFDYYSHHGRKNESFS